MSTFSLKCPNWLVEASLQLSAHLPHRPCWRSVCLLLYNMVCFRSAAIPNPFLWNWCQAIFSPVDSSVFRKFYYLAELRTAGEVQGLLFIRLVRRLQNLKNCPRRRKGAVLWAVVSVSHSCCRPPWLSSPEHLGECSCWLCSCLPCFSTSLPPVGQAFISNSCASPKSHLKNNSPSRTEINSGLPVAVFPSSLQEKFSCDW